jgi:hypothetical protein
MAKRNDTKGWKPERLDDGSVSPQGRDISAGLAKAAKSRTSTSKRGNKC